MLIILIYSVLAAIIISGVSYSQYIISLLTIFVPIMSVLSIIGMYTMYKMEDHRYNNVNDINYVVDMFIHFVFPLIFSYVFYTNAYYILAIFVSVIAIFNLTASSYLVKHKQ